MSIKQKLVWVPISDFAFYYEGEFPKYLWSLPSERNEKKPPELPYLPRHGYNAHLEDCGHDWFAVGGEKLKYHATVAGSGLWLLFEFIDTVEKKCYQCSSDVSVEMRFCSCCGTCLMEVE